MLNKLLLNVILCCVLKSRPHYTYTYTIFLTTSTWWTHISYTYINISHNQHLVDTHFIYIYQYFSQPALGGHTFINIYIYINISHNQHLVDTHSYKYRYFPQRALGGHMFIYISGPKSIETTLVSTLHR